MSKHIVVQEDQLLNYLLKVWPKHNRTKTKELMQFGYVCVQGKVVTSHKHPLKIGDSIELRPKEEIQLQYFKNSLTFPIVFEDEEIIVIDKPCFLLTMATEEEKVRTAYFELNDYMKARNSKKPSKIWIVHRLDQDTSGLLVFAKHQKTQEILQENWAEVVKKYYAVVEGVPRLSRDTIESYLVEDEYRRVYSVSNSSLKSKHAVTEYQLLGHNKKYALLEVNLVTGRKNQIRVHLSDIGHPVIGDQKYGAKTDPAKRLGLHAYYLQFPHPISGQTQVFKTALPKLLADVVQ